MKMIKTSDAAMMTEQWKMKSKMAAAIVYNERSRIEQVEMSRMKSVISRDEIAMQE